MSETDAAKDAAGDCPEDADTDVVESPGRAATSAGRDAVWSESAQRSIDAVLSSAAGHSRPVAAFDFDNTCVRGDTGDLVHRGLCERLAYDFDGRFFAQIPEDQGRQRLQAAWREHRERGADGGDPGAREALVSDLIATYLRYLNARGSEAAFHWACTLHAGMHEDTLRRLSHEIVEEELQLPGRVDLRTAPDGVVVRTRRGLRIRSPLADLMDTLCEAGVEVWVVSATNRWTVEVAVRAFGVPPARVIANSCRTDGGVILPQREGPTTYRSGKVEAMEATIGVRPLLALGDSWTDAEMLDHAEHAILIDRGDDRLRAHGIRRDWSLQPVSSLDGPD